MPGLPRLHLGVLLGLAIDDDAGEASHLRVLAVLQFDLRHVDRPQWCGSIMATKSLSGSPVMGTAAISCCILLMPAIIALSAGLAPPDMLMPAI